MNYKPFFTKKCEKRLSKIDVGFLDIFLKKIKDVLSDPLNPKRKLRGKNNFYKIKFMSPPYRVIYKVEGTKVIFLEIEHRDNVYKKLNKL